jgi:protein-disulfide isomerase
VITLTWRETSGRRARGGGESGAARVAWTFAAVLAVTVPFAWPRAALEAYEEITPATDLFDDEPETSSDPAVVASAKPRPPPRPPASLPAVPVSRVPPGSRLGIPPRPGEVTPVAPAAPTPEPRPATVPAPVGVSVPASALPSAPPPVPSAPPPLPSAPPPPPAAKPEVTVVEYLNAYCPHCRATHARLEKLIAEAGVPVRRRRVYTWATDDYPAWARACALAQSLGLEDRMFEELLRSRGPDLREVQAAAQRAGLDPQALAAALRDPAPPPRLVKDRPLFLAAGLKGLPTLDIGRRRLMGEQSEAELRSALEAARVRSAPAR